MSKHLPRLVKIITDHPKRWSGLQDEIRRFDLALATAPDEIPDKCKTLAEIVLKTILVDSGEKTDVECDSMDMEGLKVCVCQKLSLISTEDLLIKAELTYINSTRNDFGVTGHGRSLLRQSEIRNNVDPQKNEHLMQLVDNLLTQIILVYEQKFPAADNPLEPNDKYDEEINSTNDKIVINGIEYLPSEVLFNVDPDTYRSGLAEYNAEDNND